MLSEERLLAQIKALARTQTKLSRLVKGIGDDCAILRPRPQHDLVFTTDFVLEGRHFSLDNHKAADIGHKALARSLSDLAAMGSKPLFFLVSLAIPAALGQHFTSGFYRGMLALAKRHRVALAGGDSASFDRVVADVVCCGEVPMGKALLRGSARPGDVLYVTGELGGSAEGFRTGKGRNFRRHLRPEPRVAIGQALRRLGVTCCMDISDGLGTDLHRLCQESGVSAVLNGHLPVAPGATEQDALSGGEDYELVFSASKTIRIPAVMQDIPVTAVGQICKRRRSIVTWKGQPLEPRGFDHFEARSGGRAEG